MAGSRRLLDVSSFRLKSVDLRAKGREEKRFTIYHKDELAIKSFFGKAEIGKMGMHFGFSVAGRKGFPFRSQSNQNRNTMKGFAAAILMKNILRRVNLTNPDPFVPTK